MTASRLPLNGKFSMTTGTHRFMAAVSGLRARALAGVLASRLPRVDAVLGMGLLAGPDHAVFSLAAALQLESKE